MPFAAAFGRVLRALAFPCIVSGLLAFPLCGGGTYFSLPPQRKVGKRKRLEAPAKWAPWFARGSGATGIRALAHSALVTKDSSAPTPHCVRRGRVCLGNHRLRFWFVGPSASPRRRASAFTRKPPLQMNCRCPAITLMAAAVHGRATAVGKAWA